MIAGGHASAFDGISRDVVRKLQLCIEVMRQQLHNLHGDMLRGSQREAGELPVVVEARHHQQLASAGRSASGGSIDALFLQIQPPRMTQRRERMISRSGGHNKLIKEHVSLT